MGALARLLNMAGHEVQGSDTEIYPPMSDQLEAARIPVARGYDAANLAWDPECVVVGNVCRADHPEVLEAQRRGLPLESFPSMLARALLPGRERIVVAGTHGKTTTTSLLAWLLRCGGLDPSFLIGGVPLNFGTGAHLGAGKPFVLEGDEYNTAFFDRGSKFLHYKPTRAILTSVEYDHLDIFASFQEMRQAFVDFVATIEPGGELFVAADQPGAMSVAAQARCKVFTYRVLEAHVSGMHVAAPSGPAVVDYLAVIRGGPERRTRFEVFEGEHSLGEFSTHMVGRYNVANALAAIAVARRSGAQVDPLRRGLARFRGVKKRQELIGMAAGVRVFFDFAHHPTAVDLTLRAMRKRYPDYALHACFEPRSSSSRRNDFAADYARAFDAASSVYLAPVYRPDKVPPGQVLDVGALAREISEHGVTARAFPSIEALGEAVLERAVPGDTVVLMSSGDFGGLGRQLLFGFGDPVTFATEDDMAAAQDLLEGYGLPAVRPSDEVETMVIREPHGLAGTVSLQVCGQAAFLFGLAVAPERRGQGLGWVLGDIVLRRARTLGAQRCYLITNTATDFFAGKLGFSPTSAEDVDPEVAAVANFRASAGLVGAVCMMLPLSAGPDEL